MKKTKYMGYQPKSHRWLMYLHTTTPSSACWLTRLHRNSRLSVQLEKRKVPFWFKKHLYLYTCNILHKYFRSHILTSRHLFKCPHRVSFFTQQITHLPSSFPFTIAWRTIWMFHFFPCIGLATYRFSLASYFLNLILSGIPRTRS